MMQEERSGGSVCASVPARRFSLSVRNILHQQHIYPKIHHSTVVMPRAQNVLGLWLVIAALLATAPVSFARMPSYHSAQSSKSMPLPNAGALFSEYLQGLIQCGGITSLTIVVQSGQTILFQDAFGLRDLDAGIQADNGTVYGIGSCTKAFTTALIALLADQGALQWTDKVSMYIPGFRSDCSHVCLRSPCFHSLPLTPLRRLNTSWSSEEVTLADLASHHSCVTANDFSWMSGL